MLLFVAAAATAEAAPVKNFDVFAGKVETRGDAHGYGYIKWFDRGRRVTVAGRINDLCPGDGHSGQVWILANYSRGYQRVVAYPKDSAGCEGRGKKFKNTSPSLAAGKITYVRVCVWEVDQDADPDSRGDQTCKNYRR